MNYNGSEACLRWLLGCDLALRHTLLQDKNINHNMAEEVAKADAAGPSHCYYLRSRRPALDVDHTFECQLMGHALVQTESWHPLFKGEGFIDKKVSRLGVLGKALEDVHDVQNHVDNLHMLDNGINRSKRWGARLQLHPNAPPSVPSALVFFYFPIVQCPPRSPHLPFWHHRCLCVPRTPVARRIVSADDWGLLEIVGHVTHELRLQCTRRR